MTDALVQYLASRGGFGLARDALDLLITYYIFYRVALVLRGTRAIQVVFGVAFVFVLYLVSQLLQLTTVLTLLSAVLSSAILIGVVVFQNDIRRGLMRMGARARFGSAQSLEGKVIDNVVEAATALARHRTGAIITFEQDANLDEFVGSNTGHAIDAAVSKELLISLFIPEAMNQLHDGAVVIRDLRIAKAGVFFPMPDGGVSDDSFGSRHRAALGITEETDAVVVVVSEERGSISFCFNGNIIPNLDGPKLRAALEGVFVPKRKSTTTQGLWSRIFKRQETPAPTSLSALRDAKRRSPERLEDALRKARPDATVDATPPQPLRKKKTEEGDARPDSRSPDSLLNRTAEDAEQSPEAPTPTPLRKKKTPPDDGAPEPLRKKRVANAESGQHPSVPPPSEILKTPLRHLDPSLSANEPAEDGGPVSLRQPSVPMPPAPTPTPSETGRGREQPTEQRLAAPAQGSPAAEPDSEPEMPPSSTRHTISSPMQRADDVNGTNQTADSQRTEGDA